MTDARDYAPRYCIVSLPRSGTQWCESLIVNHWLKNPATDMATNLGEFFEPYNVFERYYITAQRHIRLEPQPDMSNLAELHRKFRGGNQLHELTPQKIRDLARLDPAQPLTIRHFLRSERQGDGVERELFAQLQAVGFQFISLTRSFEHGVLSRILAACIHQAYGQNIWLITRRPRLEKYYIDVEGFHVEHQCRERLNLLINWEKNITDNFGIDQWHRVRYEHMLEDLSRAMGETVSPLKMDRKTLERDPYSYMENADEVREIVDRYAQVYKQLFDQ